MRAEVRAERGLPRPDGGVPAERPGRRPRHHIPGAAIPGYVDGEVLKESIGAAIAGGRFNRVPIINGIDHQEERIFVAALGPGVTNGTIVLELEHQ